MQNVTTAKNCEFCMVAHRLVQLSCKQLDLYTDIYSLHVSSFTSGIALRHLIRHIYSP